MGVDTTTPVTRDARPARHDRGRKLCSLGRSHTGGGTAAGVALASVRVRKARGTTGACLVDTSHEEGKSTCGPERRSSRRSRPCAGRCSVLVQRLPLVGVDACMVEARYSNPLRNQPKSWWCRRTEAAYPFADPRSGDRPVSGMGMWGSPLLVILKLIDEQLTQVPRQVLHIRHVERVWVCRLHALGARAHSDADDLDV